MPTLRPFQREDVEVIKRSNLRTLLASSPGTGKAQPVDSLVLTPSGWAMLGTLAPGDLICDPDGGVAHVLSVHPQGEKQVFKVTASDGASTLCCEDHLWTVQSHDDRNRGRERTFSLGALVRAGLRSGKRGERRRWHLPVAKPVFFSPLLSEGRLPLPPYLVGALLGDGNIVDGLPRFSSADPEVLARVAEELPSSLMMTPKKGARYDYSIVSRQRRSSPHPLRITLSSLDMWGKRAQEKRIPSPYLRASAAQRAKLLRGLMDTDGTVSRGKAIFSTTSPHLSTQVQDLVRSLGGLATITSRTTSYTYKGEKKRGLRSYRVYIRSPINPFWLPRKAEAWVPDWLVRSLDQVEAVGVKECLCIHTSTKRHLYITDDYLVTHNTPIAVTSILETGRWSLPCLVVCPASVTRNWKREFKTWAPGLRTQIVEDMSSPMNRHADVYITSWALLDPREAELHGRKLRCVVADEVHMAKNPDALRSQALYRLTRGRKGILLLTGTPIINSRDEMATLEALYGQKPPMIRRLLEDIAPEIPPKKRSYLYVRPRERARVEYDKADSDFEDWLRKEKERLLGEGLAEASIERALAAEAFTKMGYLRRLIGEAKVPAAVDWVSRAVRIGEPVVVFCEHQVVLRRLVKSLRSQRIRHAVIEGKTSPKKRQKYIDQFQANRYPVLVCTKAGKEGITLHAARHLLFVERFFTSADEEQAEDRIRRIGQRHATTIWYLHAQGTVDDRLDAIVQAKRRLIRATIRSADTAETALSNVRSLVRSWESFVCEEKPTTSLGRGDPLPPLPRPGSTYAVIFGSQRWSTRAAASWCRMNGYLPYRKEALEGRFKLIIHPVEVFKPKQFTSFRVCQDVKIIVGKRLSAKNEKLMRRRLDRLKR